jgi:RNA polymerase sigma factor (sigma-70 family)
VESIPGGEAETQVPATGMSVGDLFDSSWTEMVRLATFLVGSQHAAEDLVSDTFERLAKRPAPPDEPRGYLRTSVVNACRSHLRRLHVERVHRPVPMSGSVDKPREMTDVLARLSTRQRTAVVLRYYLDLPESEIAEILGCRPGTVRSIVQRALAKLKKELTP